MITIVTTVDIFPFWFIGVFSTVNLKPNFFFTNFIYLFMAALSSFLHTGFLLIVMSGGYSSFGGFPGSSDAPESAYNVEKPSLSPCTGFSLW